MNLNQVVKPRNKFLILKPNRRISCKDLGHGDCEGWLWIKKSSLIKSKYVRRWCVLRLGCLYFYVHSENERAEGIIHLRDFRICPCENFKAKNFFFNIYNDFVSFTFAIETQSGFLKWLNKLQLSASNINPDSLEYKMSSCTPESESISKINRSATFTFGNENKIDEVPGYSESEDSDTGSEKTSVTYNEDSNEIMTPKVKVSMLAAEPIVSSMRRSEEFTEASMNAIKRVVEIERSLREKKQLLTHIDNFLKYPLNSEKIEEFWDEYGEEMLKI